MDASMSGRGVSTIRESLDGYIESCDFDNPEPWLSSHLRGVWAAWEIEMQVKGHVG